MPNKISDETVFQLFLRNEPSHVILKPWGGRDVKIGAFSLHMNGLVQRFSAWSKQSTDVETKRKILAKIKQLDCCHPEESASILIYLLTRIRQFLGNLLYNRQAELEEISNSLPALRPELPKPATAKTEAQRNVTPFLHTPEKPGPIVPRLKGQASRQQTPKKQEEIFQYYKRWNGKEDLSFPMTQELFPDIPFWSRQGSAFSQFGSAKSSTSLGNFLFDVLLTLHGITEENQRKDIRGAVYIGGNYNSIQDYKTFITDFFNQDISVRYVRDALIYLSSNQRKTQVLEACLELFTGDSLRKIIRGYCEHYTSRNKVLSKNDASLKMLLGHFTDKLSDENDKTMMMLALCLAMQTQDATIEIGWVGYTAAVLHSKKILDEEDIIALMRHYQQCHSGVFIHHEVFVALMKSLPEERSQQVIKEMEVALGPLEPPKVDPKPWVPRSMRDSGSFQTPPRTPSPALSVPPRTDLSSRHSSPSTNNFEQGKLLEYKNAEKSTAALVRVVIPQNLDFEEIHSTGSRVTLKAGSTLYVKGATVQQTIQRITGEDKPIDLTDPLTLRVVADILVFSSNNGEAKERMLQSWLPKMSSSSIQQLLVNYFHTLQVMYDGTLPDANPSPRLLLGLVLSKGIDTVGKIDKQLLMQLVKLIIPLKGDKLNGLEGLIEQMIRFQLIDMPAKAELMECFKVAHPERYPTIKAYQLIDESLSQK